MSTRSAFTQQLLTLVRSLPDEALVDLVRHRLDGVHVTPQRASTQTPRVVGVKRRTRATAAEREQLLLLVERLVKDSRGVSSTEIARMVRTDTQRVQSVLRELKQDKRIFQ